MSLQVLSSDDINDVAGAQGIDGPQFQKAVAQIGVSALAMQPISLDMLMRVAKEKGTLPRSRKELFTKGMDTLARDRMERRELRTGTPFPPSAILDAAERVACLSLFSGRELVDMGDSSGPNSLGLGELAALPNSGSILEEPLLLALGNSGLCDGDGEHRFRFVHRQYAEFLAGRRLARLLPHQAKSLLASALGWQAGVAGPFREVASFAAMESDEIAEWVTQYDPEVIGLSDVADDALRKRAMFRLLEKFRGHELTDIQIGRDEIGLAGFRYEKAEADLRLVLRERGPESDDVLECAVELISSWSLESMSGDLADFVLDSTAPIRVRHSAGYALARFGTRDARRRLKPLIAGVAEDSNLILKGLALRCNWPDDITTPELLAALVPRTDHSHYGAYESFIHEVDHSDFDAAGFTVQGLQWAQRFVRRQAGDHDPAIRIVKRIAHRAVRELGEPGVRDALVELLISFAQAHAGSPLSKIARANVLDSEEEDVPSAIPVDADTRRTLIDALVAKSPDESTLWWIAHESPGLVVLADFPWLLERAIGVALPMSLRKRYVSLNSLVQWRDDFQCVESWIAVRDTEPVSTELNIPLSLALDDEEARKERKFRREMRAENRLRARSKLSPPPHERVQEFVGLSETKDPKFFFNLCNELTLTPDSTHYDFERFLVRTHGWKTADDLTRGRIVEAARRLFLSESGEAERGTKEPLSKILGGYMPALFLLLATDPGWIGRQPDAWFQRWAWYFLRELRSSMHNEEITEKVTIVDLLLKRAPDGVRGFITELATAADAESQHLLAETLELFKSVSDSELDRKMSDLIAAGAIPADRIEIVAEFVLSRDAGRAIPATFALIDRATAASSDNSTINAALALLNVRAAETWDRVFELLRVRRDLAGRILAEFAHREPLHGDDDETESRLLAALTPLRAGQLLGFLLELFPPESAPHHEGAYSVTPEHSARQLRSMLFNWLTARDDAESVLALRELERKYGSTYPWLRRPRAQVERAYRLSKPGPTPPESVAALLAANSKRLIRSGTDAIEGVIEALTQYEHALHHHSPSDLEDLWNLPTGRPPTPRTEERISDKICIAIRRYFEEYAVTADREVQIYRRSVVGAAGGAPGSEVDVLARVPVVGAMNRDPIVLPIEVKRSSNSEARTGLRAQLLDRYMSQLGTSIGLFVVAWLDAPKMPKSHKPLWKTISEAKTELQEQVKEITSSPGAPRIDVMVLNAALARVIADSSKPTKKRAKIKIASGTNRRFKRPPSKKAERPARGRRRPTPGKTNTPKKPTPKRQPRRRPNGS